MAIIGSLVKTHFVAPSLRAPDSVDLGWDSRLTCLTGFQVWPMLLVPRSHFENHCCGVMYALGLLSGVFLCLVTCANFRVLTHSILCLPAPMFLFWPTLILGCCCLITSLCPTLPTTDCSLPGSSVHWDFPSKNARVGFHFLLQGIFLTLGLNLHLLHWEVCSSPLNHLGSSGPEF